MPIESGLYCPYCTDPTGKLQDFDDRLERLTQFTLRQEQGLTRPTARQRALEYMATMPAWRDHPRLKAALGKPAT
jgi:hypothetical protein